MACHAALCGMPQCNHDTIHTPPTTRPGAQHTVCDTPTQPQHITPQHVTHDTWQRATSRRATHGTTCGAAWHTSVRPWHDTWHHMTRSDTAARHTAQHDTRHTSPQPQHSSVPHSTTVAQHMAPHDTQDASPLLRICALMHILCAQTWQTAVPNARLDPTASLGTIVLTAHLGIQTRRSPAVHTHYSLCRSMDTKYISRLLKVHMTFLIIFLVF